MKTKLLILFAFFSLALSAQDRKPLKGIVTTSDARVPGVFVINKTSGTEVKTDARGNFTIQVRNGDRLTVHSSFTEDRDFYISADSFKQSPYVLSVETKATELEEVVVNDTLKIIQPTGRIAAYTPAERRANAGATVKPRTMAEQGGGIAIPLDRIFNGKKADNLKRELATEQLEKNIERISAIYSNEEMTQILGIPAENVQAFLYFAAEDEAVNKAIKDNNSDQLRLQLAALSQEYLQLQKEPAAAPATPATPATSSDKKQ